MKARATVDLLLHSKMCFTNGTFEFVVTILIYLPSPSAANLRTFVLLILLLLSDSSSQDARNANRFTTFVYVPEETGNNQAGT